MCTHSAHSTSYCTSPHSAQCVHTVHTVLRTVCHQTAHSAPHSAHTVPRTVLPQIDHSACAQCTQCLALYAARGQYIAHTSSPGWPPDSSSLMALPAHIIAPHCSHCECPRPQCSRPLIFAQILTSICQYRVYKKYKPFFFLLFTLISGYIYLYIIILF